MMTPVEIAALPAPNVIARLSVRDVIALTLYGEARGEGPEGRIAVANVLRNRLSRRHLGQTYRGVCLMPFQFSCWLEVGGATNYGVLIDTARLLIGGQASGPVLKECQWIADGLLSDSFVDNTHGATHYLTTNLYATRPPSWAAKARVLAQIGNHVFFRVE